MSGEENLTPWIFTIILLFSFALCSFMLLLSKYLGGLSQSREKHIPFESGINSLGTARIRFPVKFYLVAMLFVIFDVEALYIYAWSVSIRENGWHGLLEMSIFIFVLLIGLFYLFRVKALDWIPEKNEKHN